MWTEISLIYPLVLTAVSFAVAVFTSAHVVLYKRDVRAAIGWVGIIWLTPLVGSLLYWLFGINRVERRARRMRHLRASVEGSVQNVPGFDAAVELIQPSHLQPLGMYVKRVAPRPLLSGNQIDFYDNGDEAYGAMLAAIEQAQTSVALQTYIFDNDQAGKKFVAALAAAQERGVQVRVIVDDMGSRYTWPSIRGQLRAAGIRFSIFLPTLLPWQFNYSNLRSHRKILVVDGKIGFTGGMNIRDGHMPSLQPKYPVTDMHFQLRGPVAAQLQEAFALDWEFCTSEVLEGPTWFPPQQAAGDMLARGIDDGPDGSSDKIRLTLMGALACARERVTIVTPYFLPDSSLVSALNTADLRGVDVQILIPEQGNLALVQWASTAMLWQVLQRGVQIWRTPPPFDHTKLMLVDDAWIFFGSANWDPRSLRLNFEFNVEAYDVGLASRLRKVIEEKKVRSHPVYLKDVDNRSLPVRLRDGIARLMSPYL